jgi:hypothetical protein
MYLYVIINSAERALFMLNTWPQTLRLISVADKNMYLCKKQCSINNTVMYCYKRVLKFFFISILFYLFLNILQ